MGRSLHSYFVLTFLLVVPKDAFGASDGPVTEIVSRGHLGQQADRGSSGPSLSEDGSLIAFQSRATNLVPRDTNGERDIFVRDRRLQRTTMISRGLDGSPANGESREPDLSENGRVVAFLSDASNLVPGDTNGLRDVFWHDLKRNVTRRVNVASDGTEADRSASDRVAVSRDGRFVAFATRATNLVPGDTNGREDVFVHDLLTGATERVSVNSQGEQGNSSSWMASISADGRYVGFESFATNFAPDSSPATRDVFVHDRLTRNTSMVSLDTDGEQFPGSVQNSTFSSDGRRVAFQYGLGVYVRDLESAKTRDVGLRSDGERPLTGEFSNPFLSGSGRIVAFESTSGDLHPEKRSLRSQVFFFDLESETVHFASRSLNGEPNGDCDRPVVSGDGRVIVFSSGEEDIVQNDQNGRVEDLFWRVACLEGSATTYGDGWPGTKGVPRLRAFDDFAPCTSLSIAVENSSGMETSGICLWGYRSVSLQSSLDLELLVLPSFLVLLSIPANGLALSLDIPCDWSLMCQRFIILQILQLDAGATRGVSSTRALRVVFGA